MVPDRRIYKTMTRSFNNLTHRKITTLRLLRRMQKLLLVPERFHCAYLNQH